MSLNRKRRIFRPGLGALLHIGPNLPAPGVILAAVGGTATLFAVAWLFVRPSDAPAHAPASQTLTAQPDRLAVIDGNTLRIGDDIVQLQGITAPARGAICRTATAAEQDCGAAAANDLASLVRFGPTTCVIHGHDGKGRPLADCASGGISLSEAMVRDGWARAQTTGLRATEATARAASRGIWRNGGAS